jgi:isoleucyl-tRNA synthetase
MFQPFEGVPHYPELEPKILRFWEDKFIFDKLREQTQNGERWDFQDGPITANNPMGVHHAWGRTYKDIFDRYHAMKGRKLRWQNGFDCQGLWVEVEVEKDLGFNGKPDIEAFGVENFSRECRKRVEKFAAVITEQSKRLGMWMDWERSYFTFDDSNIEHIWLFLKTCHEEGWLAQDHRIMPWCPRCETSLSQHESADSYKDITHRSVFIRLPVVCPHPPPKGHPALPEGEGTGVQEGDRLLVWTTTPWTLTANVALAVNPELTYVRAKSDDEVLILSKETAKTALKPNYEIIEEISGRDLVGLKYSGPFDDLPAQQQIDASTPRRVVAWEEVGEAEGTGIVHIAPGCGAEDFELGKREGLGFIVPTDGEARFKAGFGELSGRNGIAEKDSNGNVVNDIDHIFHEIERRDRLYRIQRYKHSYPHCWRCGSELIFYATKEWFIRADAGERPARERLRKAAREVEWIPEYAGKRMDDWLVNMGDWCISRKRFWGLPLPIYMDESGEHWEVIGSRAELRERAVDKVKFDALPELHRPWIDDIEITSRDGSKVLRRIPEVGDAWLDAGIVPFSTVGYNGSPDIRMPELSIADSPADVPLGTIRNPLSEIRNPYWQPADFITEMREQVRLWFFSMLWMSVALEDRAPYKRAMVYETMLDENGDKISKTKKNGVPYDEAIAKIGADPMRWTFCGNPLNKDIRFGYKPIHESQRKLITLWNVYSFFVTYANLDKPALTPCTPSPAPRERGTGGEGSNVLDQWILARLQQTIGEVTSALENVAPSEITRSIEKFVDELSNWYVRRSRRRFWKSESDEDKTAAYRTLHEVLLTLCQLIAPVIPFTAEEMYQNLKSPLQDAPESVHLCAWPQVDESLRNDALVREVEGVLQATSLGHAARKDSKLKVRQPLRKVLVQAPSPELRAGIENWRETILDELNVKELELLDDTGDLVTYSLKANLPKLGPKFGKQIGAIRSALENASPEDAKRIGEAVRRGESTSIVVNSQTIELAADEVLVSTQQQSGYQFASENGWSVALDTALDEDLLDEGVARDFIRAVQQARKEADFEVADHIAILLVEPEGDSRLAEVLEKFGDLVQSETLADELRLVDANYPELSEAKAGEETWKFRVEKL